MKIIIGSFSKEKKRGTITQRAKDKQQKIEILNLEKKQVSLSEGIIERQRFKGYHKSPALKISPLVYREP